MAECPSSQKTWSTGFKKEYMSTYNSFDFMISNYRLMKKINQNMTPKFPKTSWKNNTTPKHQILCKTQIYGN